MKNTTSHTKLPYYLLAVAVVARFLPHPPNFTPVGATAIYSGRYFNGWTRFLVPLLAMFISDIFLGFHWTMPFVYSAFLINIFLGMWIAKKPNVPKIMLATILSSVIFFSITNFGSWLTMPMYSKDLSGLIQCYILALPFAKWTFLGDITFVTIMFGLTEFINYKYKSRKVKTKGEVICPKP